MLDIFHLDPGDPRVQIFFPRTSTGVADWQTWIKPRGISMVGIWGIGGAGGGGGGLTGATGSARGGGSGGGSATITRLFLPAFMLPDVLFVLPGLGGPGGAASGNGTIGVQTLVCVKPVNTSPYQLLQAAPGGAGLVGTTTTNTGGPAGAAAVVTSTSWLASALFLSNAGVAGGAGGSGAAAATGTGQTAFNNHILTGGCGGASTQATGNTNSAGSAVAAGGLLEILIPGGLIAGGAGVDGISSLSPFWSTGGTGGGSNGAAAQVGGKGGKGGFGSGGGGGGGGVTGGAGGDGGDGLVLIACW